LTCLFEGMDRDIKPQSEERRCRAPDSDCAASRPFDQRIPTSIVTQAIVVARSKSSYLAPGFGAIEEVAADRD